MWEGSDGVLDRLIDVAVDSAKSVTTVVIVRSPWSGRPVNDALNAVVEAVACEGCCLVAQINDFVRAVLNYQPTTTDWRAVVAGSLYPYGNQLADQYTRSFRHDLRGSWLVCDMLSIEECLENPEDQVRRRELHEQLSGLYGWRKAQGEIETLIRRLEFIGAGSENMSYLEDIRAELSRMEATVRSLQTDAPSDEVESLHQNVTRLIRLAGG